MAFSLEGMSEVEKDALMRTAAELGSNPKTRLGFQRLVKEIDPTVSTPEYDMASAFAQQNQRQEERIRKFEEEQSSREITQRALDGRTRAIRGGHVKDTEIDELEKFMIDNGMADHEKAALHYANARKLAEPAPTAAPDRYELPMDFLKSFKGKSQSDIKATVHANAIADLRAFRAGKVA